MSNEYTHEFKYVLKKGFPLAHAGNMIDAESITINAPNNAINLFTSAIETEINKAVFEMGRLFGDKQIEDDKKPKDKPVEETDKEKRDTTYMMLSAYGNMPVVLNAFKKILCTKGNAFINDVEPVNETIYNQITGVDNKEILVSYVLNFLNTSLSD